MRRRMLERSSECYLVPFIFYRSCAFTVKAMTFYPYSESAFLWWLCSFKDGKQCTDKPLILATLEYNEHASALMGTEGKDNAPSCTAKCLCSSKGDRTYIWTPSTVPGPVYDHDYPLDIFIVAWQTSSSAELERGMENAKVAPQCWCGTS